MQHGVIAGNYFHKTKLSYTVLCIKVIWAWFSGVHKQLSVRFGYIVGTCDSGLSFAKHLPTANVPLGWHLSQGKQIHPASCSASLRLLLGTRSFTLLPFLFHKSLHWDINVVLKTSFKKLSYKSWICLKKYKHIIFIYLCTRTCKTYLINQDIACRSCSLSCIMRKRDVIHCRGKTTTDLCTHFRNHNYSDRKVEQAT